MIQLIQAAPEFRFIGEAPSGREGIQLARSLRPDMILLDLNMKDMNGVEVLKTLKDDGLDARIIMLTVSDQAEDLMAALQAGADGYLLKDMDPEELMQQLVEAARAPTSRSAAGTSTSMADPARRRSSGRTRAMPNASGSRWPAGGATRRHSNSRPTTGQRPASRDTCAAPSRS